MLVVTPIGLGAVAYFVEGPAPGRWQGQAMEALGLAGPVDGPTLRRVLAGRPPGGGAPLLSPHRHRRAGWDLTFAAPKSVSLLAALAPRGDARLAAAHAGAVDDTLGWVARHGGRVRRAGAVVPACGLVVARWDHERSEAGDPHLHSHAVVANLGWADGHWSALASSPWWPTLRSAGPVYRCALRARVIGAGLDLAWRPTRAGLVELAAVDDAAVAAVSARAATVQARLAAWDGGEGADRPVRRSVRAASRGAPPDTAGWEERAGGAGLDRMGVAALLEAATTSGLAPRPPDTARVLGRLSGASAFTGLDLLAAAGGDAEAAAGPEALERWAAAVVGDPAPIGPGRRWAAPGAVGHDRALLDAAARRGGRWSVPPSTTALVAAEHRLGAHGSAALAGLVDGTGAVVVLPGAPGRSTLLAQAAVVAAARAAWEAAGWQVALAAPAAAARRWDALTGLSPAAPGRRADVLVVDRADRLPPAELARLAVAARSGGQLVVLVDGGTLPARHHPRSAAVGELRGAATAIADPEPAAPTLAVVAGPVAVGVGPGDAVRAAVAAWAAAPAGQRPTLVGLGPAEVEALNAVARAALAAEGALRGPEITAAGRPYRAGDAVVALQRASVAAGTTGVVTHVDPTAGSIEVDWGDRRRRLDRHDARHLGHAYARTAASRPAGPVVVLGDPGHVPGPVVGAAVVATGGRWDPPDRLDRMVAVDVPHDPAALSRLLPLPLGELASRRRALTSTLAGAAAPDPAALAERRLLGRAWALRADALGRALEADPASHRLGPAPASPDTRAAWRRRVRDLAAGREASPSQALDPGLGLGW